MGEEYYTGVSVVNDDGNGDVAAETNISSKALSGSSSRATSFVERAKEHALAAGRSSLTALYVHQDPGQSISNISRSEEVAIFPHNHGACPRSTISKTEAIEAVKLLHKGDGTTASEYCLVAYKQTAAGKSSSRSQSCHVYDRYYFLCPVNTLTHVGFAVCPYIMNGTCTPEHAVLTILKDGGGTTTATRHLKRHDTQDETKRNTTFREKFSLNLKRKAADAAVQAVTLDFLPYTWASGVGARALLEEVFRTGQMFPASALPDFADYLPSRHVITASLERKARDARSEDRSTFIPYILKTGGAITTDGWKCSRTGRKYYDCTYHHISAKSQICLLLTPHLR
jgi:hypothetical protein